MNSLLIKQLLVTPRSTAVISCLVLAFLFNFSPLLAQLQQTETATSGGTGYLEWLPVDYNTTTKKYPLIICLHGTGERGTNLSRVKNTGISKRIEEQIRANNPSPMTFKAGGTGPEFSFIVMTPQITGSWNAGITNGLINHAINTYRVDETRIYLTGFSLGGNGTWIYAVNARNDPARVAAIAPIAGWGPSHLVCSNGNYKDYTVWGFHGDADPTIRINRGQAIIDAYNACSPTPAPEALFTIYPGVRHNSWDRSYATDNSVNTPNLYEWFLTQRLGGNPTADAGNDITITLPTNSVVLNGSGSDSDGSITSYAWSRTGGPSSATLNNISTPNLTASDLVEGVYQFELTVTDNDGNTGQDQVQVIVNPQVVNQPPTLELGSNISITLPVNSTNIVANPSDPDGSVTTYLWSQQSGPSSAMLSGTNTNTLTSSNLLEGTYTFRLSVTDNDGASVFDEIQVIVNSAAANVPPNANAGSNQNITLPTNSTTVTGSGADSDGTIASYLWERVNGPAAVLTNENTPTLSISSLVEGVYTLRLTVTDDDGDSDTDEMLITVVAANQNPTANAGNNITITLPTNSTNLNGTGNDPDGSIVGYAWSQITGPSSASIGSPANASTSVSGLSEGTYVFQLTVTDNDGAEDIDRIDVTVLAAAVNNPPVADAGEDIFITLPTNSVTIMGSGTDSDGVIASYLWVKTSGPSSFSLTNETTASVTVSDLVAGRYAFRLRVRDDDGAQDTNLVFVDVAPATVNQSPTADAGVDQTITLPTNSVVLNGMGSDNDGTIASYSWSKLSGPAATLSGQSSTTLTASDLLEGMYEFELEVTDDNGAIGTDQVRVIVSAQNQPPTVSAGPDITLTLPNDAVTIDGIFSDSDGTVTSTVWTQISGTTVPFTPNDNTLNLTNIPQGSYTFRFSATDNNGDSSFDDVNIFVILSNQFPTVDAGSDITLRLPVNSVNITANANDPDGSVTTFLWEKVSGSTANLANTNTRTVTVSNLVEDIYEFRITVTDNDGASNNDIVRVTVQPAAVNIPPVANAGNNISITLPTNSVNITGSGSDSDGSIASYVWTKQSGPTATLSNANNPTLTVNNLIQGSYLFRLTVTDNNGAADFDDVQVTVNPEIVNQVPIANAGVDIQLTLPTNSTNINGGASDPDGTVVSYLWSQVSGPNTATLSSLSLPTITAGNLIEGVYGFNLEVTDDDGAVDNDEMIITVLPAAVNVPPVANAGSDVTIRLPTNSVNLMGSGSDPDGSIANYLWTKTSGPSATLANANTTTLSLSGLTEGNYTFELLVTDNDGASGTDEMRLTVLAESINAAPIADAGEDVTLILPEDNVEIIGNGTDGDGTIVSYRWTQVSGTVASASNTDQVNLQLIDLTEGIYRFRLTVEDDDGATGSDDVIINVLAQDTNAPPVANAGNDVTVNLPSNSLLITGMGTDSDGTISTYLWEKISGPTVTMLNTDQPGVQLNDLTEGSYTFRLTVTDDDGESDFDEVSVTVLPESINQSPVANAGPDIIIQEPETSIVANGSGQDADGTVETYLWVQVSGPNTASLSGADSPDLTAAGLIPGIYIFRLTVTDNDGETAADQVRVTVEPEDLISTDLPPTVDLGNDIRLILPENSVTINAVAEDDGIITSYLWEQLSGPPASLSRQDSTVLEVTDLQEGNYILALTVTDDSGFSTSDQVALEIFAEGSMSFPMPLFSPNGDSQNDNWILDPDLTKFEGCRLMVYNRSGLIVYEAQPYTNDWDGTTNGDGLPQGVYYYRLSCEDNSNVKSGSITLIR
ncbi:T9SS type B sorting domain-containing protein [Fulvivirga sp. M361]|uniref:PKD domain-containing protein n=1 Tax=Fulvivirga sp. M361 TaxID=2594266 RepID=UPI00117A4D90|nr:Ig-like domain-containing protein [Fulvivirga sp. M361]TRX60127.1 T9SS type B sorting domain-containing protein [Fulvivirga sp. M361]